MPRRQNERSKSYERMGVVRERPRQSRGERTDKQVAFSSYSYSSLVIPLNKAKKNTFIATSNIQFQIRRKHGTITV